MISHPAVEASAHEPSPSSSQLDPAVRVTGAGREAERQVSDYNRLSREIRRACLLERRYAYYWSRIIGLVALFAAVWALFLWIGDSWYQLAVGALLGVVVTQFGFLGHDAAHRQIFCSAGWNLWTARILTGTFAGLSYGWWTHKHNRHHGAPNQESRDPDIAKGVILLVPQHAVGARMRGISGWFTRHQGYLFVPLLLLEGINLHIAGLVMLARTPGLAHRRLELAIVSARLAGYLTVLMVTLPLDKAVAFLAVQLGVFGLLLGGSFAPNHKGMPIVPRDVKLDFLRRQVLTSRNITGGPLTDFMMGGLNYQIEHHLFPSMPRPNLRLARPIVENYCNEINVTYTSTTLFSSYAIVIRYLNTVGLRARDPFTCPLAQQLRG